MILVFENDKIIDILKNISDDELQFYKTVIHPEASYISVDSNDFQWNSNQTVVQQLISYCNYLQNQIDDIREINKRIELIEALLIDELLFSPTFGKERDQINVHFTK